MNILRLSTVSLTLAIALMTLGYANPSFADKPDPNHDHGGDGAAFDVDIGVLGEPLQGGSGGNPWLQSFGGKNSIGLNDASPTGLDVGTLTGLGSFTGKTSLCFPGDTVPPNPDHGLSPELHQAIINSGKKGRAEASFWFHGATTNGMVRLIYVLKLFGKFQDGMDWPGAQTLTMDTWELKVENEGKTIKEASCQGDGLDVVVTLEVTVTP